MSDTDIYARLHRDWLVDHGELEEGAGFRLTQSQRSRVETILLEMRQRQAESLAMFRPLPLLADFHSCRAPERVVRGSNRSGKTLHAAVECARIVTAQDPFKKLRERNGRCVIVGKDGRHNSEVLFRKLFRFGAMRMLETNMKGRKRWVGFNPSNPNHLKREEEAKPAPPLIPPRFIKDIAWESKKESSPRLITLTTGWELMFCTSLGKPPQGIDVDYVWMDEEIVDEEWYPEMSARLIDREGLFVWSATAQLGGQQLFELCERADAEKAAGITDPIIVQFFAHINDNTHFSEKQRQQFFGKLSAEQIRVRVEGEFAFTERLVYPEFSEKIHGLPWFQIPDDWSRWMIVDPGRQVCAVLFAAVPSPSHKLAGSIVLYDELYIKQCDAAKFADQVRHKAMGQNFHEFIIDSRGSRVTDTGSGANIEVQYSRELKRVGVSSKSTNYGFNPASNDIPSGIQAVSSLLVQRGERPPKLRYFPDKMPMFKHEIERYRYKKVGNKLTDKPEDRNDHLMDCTRYLAMRDPKWVKPKKRKHINHGVNNRLKEKRKNLSPTGVNLGPGD